MHWPLMTSHSILNTSKFLRNLCQVCLNIEEQ